MDHKKNRVSESGNVLFLILIAVALFAALSYAVTQSTRGGGNADDETSLISSASLTQYPASLKTSLLRMQISNGVTDEQLEFNNPASAVTCVTTGNCVFDADGGGASYQQAPSSVMANSSLGSWTFNAENEVMNIGTSGSGDAVTAGTADVTAFLDGIRAGICLKINQELGIMTNAQAVGDIPDENANIDVTTNVDGTNVEATFTPAGGTIGDTGTSNTTLLDGQPFGCFQDNGGNYVYYHVLSEN